MKQYEFVAVASNGATVAHAFVGSDNEESAKKRFWNGLGKSKQDAIESIECIDILPLKDERTVCLQLCRSNSIGNMYRSPTVISWNNYTPEDADVLLAEPMVNNYFYRRYPQESHE